VPYGAAPQKGVIKMIDAVEVLSRETHGELTDDIQKGIELGYQPQGSVSVSMCMDFGSGRSYAVYSVLMVRTKQ